MRIQKYLSQQGILSRREAERYMQKGWIQVNGEVVTELGRQIDPAIDKVTVHAPDTVKKETLLAFHKPVGVVTHCPQDGEYEIRDLLPAQYQHLAPIGRLDKASEGLILLTDNGIWARELLQGKPAHVRVYEVDVDQELTQGQLKKCEEGLMLFGQKTLPLTIAFLQVVDDHAYRYRWEMKEGKNRQIRRMIQKVGAGVLRLKRVAYGAYDLDDLACGDVRLLPGLLACS
eukprot:COSAG01_NODE_61_length_29729_cov_196.711779_18_plen_230_part_00